MIKCQIALFLTYLSCIQSTSYEMPEWMNHKLESTLPGETSTTSDMQKCRGISATFLMAESVEELDGGERGG